MQLKPSSEYFTDRSNAVFLLWIVFCYLCFLLMCVVLSRLFRVALWSPAGKGLTSWQLFVLCFVLVSIRIKGGGGVGAVKLV